MAYCRYGCPTGALLDFVRSTSSREKFALHDLAAAMLLATGLFLTLKPKDTVRPTEPAATSQPQELRGTAFGTTWSLKLREKPANPDTLRALIATELERIEATLSHWRPDSATSRFNASRSIEPQTVPEELFRLVTFASRLSQASNGAYDITVAPLVDAWGYGPSGEHKTPPSPVEISRLKETVGWQKVQIGKDACTLSKSNPELRLDLGSILQGYACDRVAQIVRANGSSEFLVEVGGELLAAGRWTVAIENPADSKKPLRVFQIENAALATSGLARARHKLSGVTVSHIISPRTGQPVQPDIEVCSVQMPTCLEADGWATAIIACGLPEARILIEKESLRAWLFDQKGAISP